MTITHQEKNKSDCLPLGRLIDIGGYSLHINYTGKGGPAVVMEAGLGGYSLDWSLVQPEIAKFTSVCTYDRAGYGWSDSGPIPRTSKQIVKELHVLLVNAGIRPPYVLVGHSFGGLNVRLYASMYSDDVAGIVLIDSSHEEQFLRLPKEYAKFQSLNLKVQNIGRLLAPLGVMRLMKMPLPFVYKKLPLEIQLMIKKVGFYPKGYSASYHELRALKESMVQVRAATKIPNIPLIVLSSKNTVSRSEVPAGIPVDKINKAHIELQRELAALSSKSEHIITKKSGHYIQLDQPELTVEAIRKIVDQVRG